MPGSVTDNSVNSSNRSPGRNFDPKTHYPEPNLSQAMVADRLKKSILDEVSEQEAASRIELAAAYRVFGMKVCGAIVCSTCKHLISLAMMPMHDSPRTSASSDNAVIGCAGLE